MYNFFSNLIFYGVPFSLVLFFHMCKVPNSQKISQIKNNNINEKRTLHNNIKKLIYSPSSFNGGKIIKKE